MYSEDIDERGAVELDVPETEKLGFWMAVRKTPVFEEKPGTLSLDFIFSPLTKEEITGKKITDKSIENLIRHNRRLLHEKGLVWTITINMDEFANANDVLREEAFWHEIGHLYFHDKMYREKGRIRFLSKEECDEAEAYAIDFARKKMAGLYGKDILDSLNE